MSKSISVAGLRGIKNGMFATRDSCDEALEYAQSMFAKEDLAALTTAIMVYHNTLLEAIARSVENGDK